MCKLYSCIFIEDDRVYLTPEKDFPTCEMDAQIDPNHPDNHSVFLGQQIGYTQDYIGIDAKNVSQNATNIQTLLKTLRAIPIRSLIQTLPSDKLLPIFRASQLLRWQKEHRFCSRCGTATMSHAHENAMVCPKCHYHQYPRLQPCVIVSITKNIQGKQHLLLAKEKRRKLPFYTLIAGFVEVGETLEDAVKRETMEEVGLHVKNLQYLSSQPWPFPSNLMIAFQAEYADGDITLAEDEIAEADFFPVDDLPTIPPKGSIAYQMIERLME